MIARFFVKKEKGSMFAYVTDRETDETIKRYDVFKGHGKLNGWNMADEHARRLNAAIESQRSGDGSCER